MSRTRYEELDALKEFRLGPVAYWWAEIPLPENPQRVPGDSPAYVTFQMLKQELANLRPQHVKKGWWPKGNTFVTREELHRIAERRDERPKFLFPGERSKRSMNYATAERRKSATRLRELARDKQYNSYSKAQVVKLIQDEFPKLPRHAIEEERELLLSEDEFWSHPWKNVGRRPKRKSS